MPSFVRKNLLTISGKFFTAPTGPCGNPNPQNWGDGNGWWGSPGCTGPGQSPAFQATAAVNGSTATVSNVGFGNLEPGNLFTMPGIPIGTTIVAQLTGAVGGIGTYELSNGGLSIPIGQVVGYFVPIPAPEPSTVNCTLTYYAPVAPLPPCPPNGWPFGSPGYCPPAPQQLSQTISLTLQSDGVTWSGTWNSDVAEGRVDWVVYSAGSVQAAAQGNFYVQANSANVSVS
jgi:hypothetical protein